jgi:hypothetical protein
LIAAPASKTVDSKKQRSAKALHDSESIQLIAACTYAGSADNAVAPLFFCERTHFFASDINGFQFQ